MNTLVKHTMVGTGFVIALILSASATQAQSRYVHGQRGAVASEGPGYARAISPGQGGPRGSQRGAGQNVYRPAAGYARPPIGGAFAAAGLGYPRGLAARQINHRRAYQGAAPSAYHPVSRYHRRQAGYVAAGLGAAAGLGIGVGAGYASGQAYYGSGYSQTYQGGNGYSYARPYYAAPQGPSVYYNHPHYTGGYSSAAPIYAPQTWSQTYQVPTTYYRTVRKTCSCWFE